MKNRFIYILGANGMLGHKVYQKCDLQYKGVKCTMQGKMDKKKNIFIKKSNLITNMNVMEYESFAGRIKEEMPDFLVNCIGIIKQRDASKASIPSIYINSLLPHKLAELAAEWGGRLIHFSTDCVFSGRDGKYTEESPSDAEDLYGKTKYLGEVTSPNALTLRTSIIGRELSSFASLLEWFLAQKGRKVKGFKKVIYSGVTTNYMAELVCKIIEEKPTLSGLYQVTSPPISKYDLLRRLKEAYNLDVTIEPEDETVSDRSMIGEKFVKATGYQIPTWDYLIEQLVSDPTPYDEWR